MNARSERSYSRQFGLGIAGAVAISVSGQIVGSGAVNGQQQYVVLCVGALEVRKDKITKRIGYVDEKSGAYLNSYAAQRGLYLALS